MQWSRFNMHKLSTIWLHKPHHTENEMYIAVQVCYTENETKIKLRPAISEYTLSCISEVQFKMGSTHAYEWHTELEI